MLPSQVNMENKVISDYVYQVIINATEVTYISFTDMSQLTNVHMTKRSQRARVDLVDVPHPGKY